MNRDAFIRCENVRYMARLVNELHREIESISALLVALNHLHAAQKGPAMKAARAKTLRELVRETAVRDQRLAMLERFRAEVGAEREKVTSDQLFRLYP